MKIVTWEEREERPGSTLACCEHALRMAERLAPFVKAGGDFTTLDLTVKMSSNSTKSRVANAVRAPALEMSSSDTCGADPPLLWAL